MGVIFRMFSQLARLGVTRAAAFFYAVAVGVVANVVIAHLSPHDDIPAKAPSALPPATTAAISTPAATAVIAPKPAEPVKPIEVSAPPVIPAPPPPMMTAPPVNAAAVPPPPPVLPASVAATLPTPETLAPPPLKPAAFPTTPAVPAPTAPTPVATDGKPAPDKPANNVEAAASVNGAAPISLLPQPDPPKDPPAPKQPGPGSGGLY